MQNYLIHYGRSKKDGAPGIGTGNWDRSGTASFVKEIKSLNDDMNETWDYGVLHDKKHILDTSKFNWDKDYRTTPVETLEKEKIGVCWDFVNYQHSKLKKLGIKDKSYLLFMQRSNDPKDAITHTFTTFELNGKEYWMESAAWPKRGVHEINGWRDVVEDLRDMYGNPKFGYSLFQYNPEGMDHGLSPDEFVDIATKDENYVYDEELKHYGRSKKDGAPGIGTGNWDRKVFVSGSSKTTTEDSGYYRKELNQKVREKLDEMISDRAHINVGDAPGIDRQVQDYLKSKRYNKVTVYGPGAQVRYSANPKWETKPVDDPDHEPGSKEWLAKKDEAMTEDSNEGLAIILDEGSRATRNNIDRLISQNKDVNIFQLSGKSEEFDDWLDKNEYLMSKKVG